VEGKALSMPCHVEYELDEYMRVNKNEQDKAREGQEEK